MAAAFGALVSLKNNLLLIQNHPRHSFSFDEKQIQSLLESVSFLIEFMKSYDNSYGAEKGAAEALEMRIARAAEAAEDVIETHVVDQIRGGKTLSKTRSRCFLLDVQKVIQEMDYMRRKAINVKAQSRIGAEQPIHSYSAAATSSKLTQSKLTSEKKGAERELSMVGFDVVLLQLFDLLTGVPSSRRAIPIVGMGGIGKTTLATNAFKHPLLDEHFNICLWATISQQYSVEKILTQLVSGLKNSTTNIDTSGTAGDLGQQLYQSLFGRRYLIILDDMWNHQAWDDIQFFFPDTNNGSRIVVTTRHTDVAKHVGSLSLSLSFLDEDSSWVLFCQKAFSEQGCPPTLEKIGKKIVAECKGFPLAIVVVGGHLRKSSMTQEYWESVSRDMNSILYSTDNDEQCSNVLSLSYSYLPAHLKPCFLLLGAFQEDGYIARRDICQLWISEGLIEPSENTIMEVVAQDYLWDLHERNLILVDGLGFNGIIMYLKIHDVLRELCIKIGKRERFLSVLDSSRAINRGRRVVIDRGAAEVNCQTKTLDASMRCLIYEGGWPSNDLKLLRTLNKVVPQSTRVSIFQQVNLRFLQVDLRATPLQAFYLPSSISQLWNLQILKIDLTSSSTMIAPCEIWEMMQLRHLEVDQIRLVDPLPEDRLDKRNDTVLRYLHTLWKVENFRLSEEVYKRIPNIKEMRLLYYKKASPYYCPQNLCYFHKLESLVCSFDLNSNWCDFALSLTFPSSLKWLFLTGCRVDWEKLTMMVGSLPHLTGLRLWSNAVVGREWTSVEGKFLNLKHLQICDCGDLVIWNVESSHFPVLEALKLSYLSQLEEIPSGMGEILTLKSIKLDFCSIASTLSAIRVLVEQEEQGNQDLELHVSLSGDDETLESFNNQVEEENLTSNNLYLSLHRL